MTIQELKKQIRQIISEDICTTDRVEKLWDFIIENVNIIKQYRIISKPNIQLTPEELYKLQIEILEETDFDTLLHYLPDALKLKCNIALLQGSSEEEVKQYLIKKLVRKP